MAKLTPRQRKTLETLLRTSKQALDVLAVSDVVEPEFEPIILGLRALVPRLQTRLHTMRE